MFIFNNCFLLISMPIPNLHKSIVKCKFILFIYYIYYIYNLLLFITSTRLLCFSQIVKYVVHLFPFLLYIEHNYAPEATVFYKTQQLKLQYFVYQKRMENCHFTFTKHIT